jgi:hypothetical protein
MFRLMIADLDSPSYFVAIAAVELGFFKREGIAVELERTYGAHNGADRLRDGTLHFFGGPTYSAATAFPAWKGARLLCALSQYSYWFLAPQRGGAGLSRARGPGDRAVRARRHHRRAGTAHRGEVERKSRQAVLRGKRDRGLHQYRHGPSRQGSARRLHQPRHEHACFTPSCTSSEARRVPTYPHRYAPILQGDRKSANIRAVRNSSENDKIRSAGRHDRLQRRGGLPCVARV